MSAPFFLHVGASRTPIHVSTAGRAINRNFGSACGFRAHDCARSGRGVSSCDTTLMGSTQKERKQENRCRVFPRNTFRSCRLSNGPWHTTCSFFLLLVCGETTFVRKGTNSPTYVEDDSLFSQWRRQRCRSVSYVATDTSSNPVAHQIFFRKTEKKKNGGCVSRRHALTGYRTRNF